MQMKQIQANSFEKFRTTYHNVSHYQTCNDKKQFHKMKCKHKGPIYFRNMHPLIQTNT